MNTLTAKISIQKVDDDYRGRYLAKVAVKDIVVFEDYYYDKPTDLEVLKEAREHVEATA